MSGPPPSQRSRNLRNLPTDHANALAREGASRGVSANDVMLQVIAAHVQGHGVATDDLIELDVARLYQKLGDGAAVAMVGTAQRLLAWVLIFPWAWNPRLLLPLFQSPPRTRTRPEALTQLWGRVRRFAFPLEPFSPPSRPPPSGSTARPRLCRRP